MAKACANHPGSAAVAFCVKCGTPMCPACEHPVDGRPFCGLCLDIKRREELIGAIQQLQPSEETVRRVKAAAFLPFKNKEIRRVIAVAIDIIFTLVLALPVSLIVYGLSLLLMPIVHGLPFGLSYYLAAALSWMAYYFTAHWKWGRTLGKSLLGLKVMRTDGAALTAGGAFWRLMGFITIFIWAGAAWKCALWISKLVVKAGASGAVTNRAGGGLVFLIVFICIVTATFFSLGVLITFVGKHKRGFHDIIGGSVVISEGWELTEQKVELNIPGSA